MKQCSKCCEMLPFSEFGKRKQSTDGFKGICKSCAAIKRAEYEAKRRKLTLVQNREAFFKRAYGLTFADRTKLYIDQNGRCAICEDPVPLDKIAVDHDHKINKVRGLLCYSCNRNLVGIENKEFRIKALKYLGDG